MSNVTLSFPEFPDNAPLTANTNYVVTTAHPITAVNAIIPKNVTLYFYGGRLDAGTTGIELVGNQTRLVAPIDQIFGTTLKVGGIWCIDRSYPQWFGAKTGFEFDCSSAINKAILMKETGEVFIPRGRYMIRKTIYVKMGIVLVGEAGRDDPNEKNYGTVLMTRTNDQTGDSEFTKGYLMMVNAIVNSSGKIVWEVENSHPGTVIKNLYFLNTLRNIPNLKGLYSAGSLVVDFCTWHYFQQAMDTDYGYSDLKKVINCTFTEAGGMHSDILYAFDLRGSGDALIFEHNAIHNGDKCKALHLNLCNGGIITSNVMNADIYIEGCKGIVCESNHMEAGKQIVIQDSNITLLNNYLWKGSRPSLVVRSSGYGDTPVVGLSNNLFVFYEAESNIEKVCEYDVMLDQTNGKNAILNISHTYRYWVKRGNIYKMHNYGINICTKDDKDLQSPQPLSSFNNYSYLLSSSSSIMPGDNIINSSYMNNLNEVAMGINGLGDSIWVEESGKYYYKYQDIWDLDRKIAGNAVEIGSVDLTTGGSGVRMIGWNGSKNGYQVFMRLYRGINNTYTEYVDIPMCGTAYLFDNGDSVCGFKWKPFTGGALTGNTMIESIAYKGKNIECKASSQPTTGIWQKGDIVYNTSPNGTNFAWTYVETSPGIFAWKAR